MIIQKESQSPGTPHWRRTWEVWVLSGEYETGVLEICINWAGGDWTTAQELEVCEGGE
jgi:hypothetical protein